jgi:hypothetical protein
MHYWSNLFWYRTLHVSDRFTVRHQESDEFYTKINLRNVHLVGVYYKNILDNVTLKL